nr:protein SSX7-like [Saimiri boliviensis boliviensis]
MMTAPLQSPRDDAQVSKKGHKAFNDTVRYFSKKNREKLKNSEKITYVCMKRNYETMTKLGLKATLPTFMYNKWATDLQGNDSDRHHNCGNQDEHTQMAFSMLQGNFPKMMPKKPAEEGNYSKGVPEAYVSQNDGKQLCPPGKQSTSEKIHKISGPTECEKESI